VKYKLVIFDFDGTLADSFQCALDAADQLTDKHGIMRIDRSQLESMRGSNVRALLKMYKVPMWKLPWLLRDVRRLLSAAAGQIPMFDGMEELLARLSTQGTQLAVVTSNSFQNVQLVLGQETAALVDYYECGVGLFGKRERFRKILKKSGIAQADTICIGDETRDIEAARSANLSCAAVAWGYARADTLAAHAPDYVFFSVDQLAQNLLG
jgi:phosphoglycolate phosphatase